MERLAQSEEAILAASSEEDVKDQSLQSLYREWAAARGPNDFPPHDSISILDHPIEARFWCVLDVVQDGTDFRCRFFGPDFVDFVGADVTGKLMSDFRHDLPGQLFRERALATMRLIVKKRHPLTVAPRRSAAKDKEYVKFSSLTLPFSKDGTSITRILHAVTVLREYED